MNNLFGDRFLRLFAGDLQRRPKRTKSNGKDQTEAIAEGAVEPVDNAPQGGHEKNSAEGNVLPNEEE